jgi:large subunit ribosomal protein L2
MAVRFAKPYNPSTRFRAVSDFGDLSRIRPSNLNCRKRALAGRNSSGVTTLRCRGGGHKRRYRIVDFHRRFTLDFFPSHLLRPVCENSDGGKVIALEYDPNRNARLALLHYLNGVKEYIIAPRSLKVGMVVYSGFNAPFEVGNAMPLEFIPIGSFVHNVELTLGKGGQLARAAGACAKLLSKGGKYVTLRLPSKEVRFVNKKCYATIGQVGNVDCLNITIGKAGRSRWLGKRPKVRGLARNPVDHPHGGGEGRTGIGRSPRTPWGKLALGVKTRDPRFTRFSKKESTKYIIKRRPKKRKKN